MKQKAYTINISCPSYLKRTFFTDTFLYFVDISSGQQLSFEKTVESINPEQLKMIIKTNIIKQATASIRSDTSGIKWSDFILGAILGAVTSALLLYIFVINAEQITGGIGL